MARIKKQYFIFEDRAYAELFFTEGKNSIDSLVKEARGSFPKLVPSEIHIRYFEKEKITGISFRIPDSNKDIIPRSYKVITLDWHRKFRY